MIETSLLDWDGKIVSTLYTPYCNFRCPWCQNSGLVLNPEEYETIEFSRIADHLLKHKDWLDGIVLTGGEPCLYKDLEIFLEKIRDLGMLIKLDTNGTFPKKLAAVLKAGMVDYIALDIKAPLNDSGYDQAAGVRVNLDKIKESIRIIMNADIDYEFRTTVVPTLHRGENIIRIAKSISGAKRYALQNFIPQDTLDPEYLKIKPYPREKLEEFSQAASPYVKECMVRGK